MLAIGIGYFKKVIALVGSCLAALCFGYSFITNNVGAFTLPLYSPFTIDLFFTPNEYLLCLVICSILLILQIIAYVYKESYLKTNLLNFFATVMCCIISANNTFTLYIFIELAGLLSSFFVFLETYKYKNNNNIHKNHISNSVKKNAKRVFVYNQFASLLLLIGICVLYNQYNTFSFNVQSELAAWLIFISCLCKSAQLPFSFWLLYATSANVFASILLHCASAIGIGVFCIVKFSTLFSIPAINFAMTGAGLATGLVFAIFSLYQSDIKKIIACLTIAAGGIMFICCGLKLYDIGINYFLYHALYKSLLFLLCMIYMKIFHSRNINDFYIFPQIKFFNRMMFAIVFCISIISDCKLPNFTIGISSIMHFVLVKMFLKLENSDCKIKTFPKTDFNLISIVSIIVIIIVMYTAPLSIEIFWNLCTFVLIFMCACYLRWNAFNARYFSSKRYYLQDIWIRQLNSINILLEKTYINLMFRIPYKINSFLYSKRPSITGYILVILVSLAILVIYAI